MKIPTHIRYGVRALCDIAHNSRGTAIPVRSISERQDISQRYIEQIFQKLKKGGIVGSIRGPDGGYYLTRNPYDISVGDVIRAIDGRDIQLTPCKGGGERSRKVCARSGKCVVSDMWTEATRMLADYFNSISLGKICAGMKSRETNHAHRLGRQGVVERATPARSCKPGRVSGAVPPMRSPADSHAFPGEGSQAPDDAPPVPERVEADGQKSLQG